MTLTFFCHFRSQYASITAQRPTTPSPTKSELHYLRPQSGQEASSLAPRTTVVRGLQSVQCGQSARAPGCATTLASPQRAVRYDSMISGESSSPKSQARLSEGREHDRERHAIPSRSTHSVLYVFGQQAHAQPFALAYARGGLRIFPCVVTHSTPRPLGVAKPNHSRRGIGGGEGARGPSPGGRPRSRTAQRGPRRRRGPGDHSLSPARRRRFGRAAGTDSRPGDWGDVHRDPYREHSARSGRLHPSSDVAQSRRFCGEELLAPHGGRTSIDGSPMPVNRSAALGRRGAIYGGDGRCTVVCTGRGR